MKRSGSSVHALHMSAQSERRLGFSSSQAKANLEVRCARIGRRRTSPGSPRRGAAYPTWCVSRAKVGARMARRCRQGRSDERVRYGLVRCRARQPNQGMSSPKKEPHTAEYAERGGSQMTWIRHYPWFRRAFRSTAGSAASAFSSERRIESSRFVTLYATGSFIASTASSSSPLK